MPVNGSPQETLAINDRGTSYGDGLFETILIHKRLPVLFDAHLERLMKGAASLKINLDRDVLKKEITDYSAEFPARGVLKIVVTRGCGGRGYRPAADMETTRVLSLHPLPDYGDEHAGRHPNEGIDAFVCNQRLAIQPSLAGIKHLNRLEQVLAAMEWPAHGDYMEGIMLDMEGNVIEGTRSNVFWAEQGNLLTPSLTRCGVAGIMRNTLLEKIPGTAEVEDSSLERILAADEAFVCNSIFGIWPLDRMRVGTVDHAVSTQKEQRYFTRQARSVFDELLENHGD